MLTYYNDLEDKNPCLNSYCLKHLIISKINMCRNLEKYIISTIKGIGGWVWRLLFNSQNTSIRPTQKK